MNTSSKYETIVNNNGILSLTLFLCLFCFCFACRNHSANDEHPEYFSGVYKKVDTTQNAHKDIALVFLDSAFNAFQDPGIGDLYAKDSVKETIYSFVKHDNVKAISYVDSMLQIAQERLGEEKYAERYARSLYVKGDCFRYMKRYNEALQYYTLGEQAVLNHVKNKCAMAEYGGSIAVLMFAQQKYLLGAAYFLKEYNGLLSACNNNNYRHLMNLEASLNNAALCYLKAGVYDSAVYYENAALNTINKDENKYPAEYFNTEYAKAVIYGDQAEVFTIRGKFDEAEDLYKKSIAGTSKADISYTQVTQARLAELYLKEKKNQPAEQTLQQLKISLDTLSNETQLLKWYQLKVKNYAQKKQIDTAFQYQQEYESLRDSVEARDRKFVNTDLAKEFENLELKYSNEVLQKESKLKTLYLIISILAIIMAASIAMLVWYNLKRAKKLNLQIQQKNDELQNAFSSLEQSHNENTRIMKIVAHDLKNPISAIHNMVHSLLQKEQSSSQKEILEVIQTSCINSIALIKDLLDEKKEGSGIKKELVDIATLLEYCVQLLQTKADEKKQVLKLHAEHADIMINSQKIWRVISNIINNAIKFSPESSVINVNLQKNDAGVLLSVHDHGIGIPQQLKDKIFSLSAASARPGTHGEKSYGLGLSISQKIVEEHKGKLWFESKEGEGSVFYVALPGMN